MAHHAFEVEIDAHRVLQLHEVGRTQRRRLGGVGGVRGIGQTGFLSGRDQRKVGVGGGQENNGARRLFKVDGLVVVAEGAGLGGEQVHGSGPGLGGDPIDGLGETGPIQIVLTDADNGGAAGFIVAPFAVEVALESGCQPLAERTAGACLQRR